MDAVIKAKDLRKSYRKTQALNDVSLEVERGRIVGLIGPNGAGKTTLLRALTGLLRVDGDLDVLGQHPWSERVKLMRDVAFIADTATLPKWARINQILTYTEAVHPNFSRKRAENFLKQTGIDTSRRIKTLSKGMKVQVHLALVMAIDASLLVLDEPTLGLDILFRKTFYTNLLNDYFDENRTIIVSTHQIEEIEHILTDVVFINQGRIMLDSSMDDINARYATVAVKRDNVEAARKLKPIQENVLLGQHVFLFEGVPAEKLQSLGEVSPTRVADLFTAKMQEKQA
jgi:ABC-2 type transport system ATP-binding protein